MAKLSTSSLLIILSFYLLSNVDAHLSSLALIATDSRNCSSEASSDNETTATSPSGNQPSPIPALSEECWKVIAMFSQSMANFTSCLVMHARPLTFCRGCIREFQIVQHWYQNITTPSEAKCDSELLNRDHLMVVQSLAHDVNYYWGNAQCDNCYSHGNAVSSEPKPCNDTLKFFDSLKNVTQCINETSVTYESPKNISKVCEMCRQVYLELNEYYEEMNTKYNNRLCMDVVDAMNITRHLWSSTYMCNILQVAGLPVLLTSMGLFFLPLTFYCGNRYVGIAKDTRLVPQKRMSFVQTSYSSVSVQR